MFGWLVNLLVKAPIAGFGCACCEAKKEQLKQMQKAVLKGCFDADEERQNSACCGGHVSEQSVEAEDMHSSFRYKL